VIVPAGAVRWPRYLNYRDLSGLTPADLKTLAYLMSLAKRYQRVPIKSLIEYLGPTATRQTISKSLEKLRDRAPDGFSFLDHRSQIEKSSIFLRLDHEFAKSLVYPGAYGKLDIAALRALKTYIAIRLYQVLTERQHSQGKWKWQPTVVELLEKLGRNPDEVERPDNLKRALKPALKELNAARVFGPGHHIKTFYVRTHGRGRKLAFISFTISGFSPDTVPAPIPQIAPPVDDLEPAQPEELFGEERGPLRVKPATVAPGDYRIAHISFSERRRRECNLRREQYGEGQLTTVFHAIKPEPVTRGNVENLRESVCGIVPRWYGFGNAPGSQPYQPNILERLALEVGDNVPAVKKAMRRPKEWVYDDIHNEDQPVTCRYCLTALKREQPSTRPELRRRPCKEAKPVQKKLPRQLKLAL
jgi:hypothetical protein